jgi:quinoprotein glucose dehydrogenase
VFPVEERPVPASDVPGEEAWPTQPFSSLPPLSPQRIDPDDAWGITPLDRRHCRQKLSRLRNEGIFTPPSLRGSVVRPHYVGGAHWGGVTYDPARSIVVAPVNTVAAYIRLVTEESTVREEEADDEFAGMRGTPYGMRRGILTSRLKFPCTPPPLGALVAISLESGNKVWEVPLGTTRDLFANRIKLPIDRPWGTPNLGGAIATAGGLVFVGAAMDDYLRAFDVETGRELWRGRLPAGGQATPMTYRLEPDGRQYVVIAAGGHGRLGTNPGDALVAFALPKEGAEDPE